MLSTCCDYFSVRYEHRNGRRAIRPSGSHYLFHTRHFGIFYNTISNFNSHFTLRISRFYRNVKALFKGAISHSVIRGGWGMGGGGRIFFLR